MANSRKLRRAPDPADLTQHLAAFLQRHVTPGSHVTLGLSGGLDSCVLLDLLAGLRPQVGFRLSAIHVNHHISPNAQNWAEFCGQQCAAYDVPLNIIDVDVPRNSGLGLEAAAREARYKALLEHSTDVLLLAHHQDDQAETLLLQLLRGAGADGLAAMPVHGIRASVSVLRPLLGFSRSALEAYASAKTLRWVEDESNQDPSYDRNFLRHEVFPILERRFSAYRATLSRAVENLNDASLLLTQLAEVDAGLAVSDGKLDVAWMKTQTPERSMNLLRWWIRNETGVNLSRARLLNILDQLLNAQANAQIYCQVGKMVLRRYRNWACVDRRENCLPYRISWHGEDVLSLPDGSRLHFKQVVGQGISANEIKDGMIITNRFGAVPGWKLSLRPDCNRPTRSLKNLWQETGIPPWERDRQPLCWNNGILMAVLGLGVDCGKLAGKNELGVLVTLSESSGA